MQKYVIGTIIIAGLLIAQSDSLIVQAVELRDNRHMNVQNLLKSKELLEHYLALDPENVKALYELSNVYRLLGDNSSGKKEKLELYNTGLECGKKAKSLDNNSAWAHFWYMVNMGRIGQTKGVLNSLSMVPEIKKEIDIVLKIDSLHTGALDARAMLFYELPGVFGGDLNKSLLALNQGIAIDSNYTLLYVDMAKVLIKKKEFEKARWFLNYALSIANPSYPADHTLDDQPEAVELLKEIEDKE